MFDEEEEYGGWSASSSSSSSKSVSSAPTQLSEAESRAILIEDFLSTIEEAGEELSAFGDYFSIDDFTIDDLEALCNFNVTMMEPGTGVHLSTNLDNLATASDNLRYLKTFFVGYEKLPLMQSLNNPPSDFSDGGAYSQAVILNAIILHINQERAIKVEQKIGRNAEEHIKLFLTKFVPSDLTHIAEILNFHELDYADLEFLLWFEGIDPFIELDNPLPPIESVYDPIAALNSLTHYFIYRYPHLPISLYLREHRNLFDIDLKTAKSIVEGMQTFIAHGREKRTFEPDNLRVKKSPVDITGVPSDILKLGSEIANGGICSTRTNSILAMLGEIRAKSSSRLAIISVKNFFDREADYRLYPQAQGDGPLVALQNRIRRSRLESSLKREILHSFHAVGLPIKHKQTGYDVSFGFAENQIGFIVKGKFIPIIALEDNRQIPGIGNCSGTKVNTSLFAKQFPQGVVSLSDDENEIIATIDSSNFMLAQKDSTRGDGFYVVADVLNTFLNALNQHRPERRQESIDRLYDLFAMDIVICQELGIDHSKSYATEVNIRNFVNEIVSRSNAKGELIHKDDCDDLDNPANSFEQHVQLTVGDDGSISISRFLVRDFGKVGNRQDLYALTLGADLGDVHEEIFNNRVNGLVDATSTIDSVLGDARSIKGLEKILVASRAAHIGF